MNSESTWQWDESIPISTDFSDRKVVEAYDARHRQFRDIDGENIDRIARLHLQPGQTVADFGCGTGAFVRQAARLGARVLAIDLSAAMLDFTKWKADEEGLTAIDYHQSGFLTYAHDGPPVDAVTTSMALHHLPDFWKQNALSRMAGLLKPGGRFHLADVVFSDEDTDQHIEAWIERMGKLGGSDILSSIRSHVRKEYSTFTWILEGILTRAGFRIEEAEFSDGVFARYTCIKD
jgi:putative AdoMet-dependent methyltransferase